MGKSAHQAYRTGKKIEGWDLLANPDNPSQKFTPCLPDLHVSKVGETFERVTLVPIRFNAVEVTIFRRSGAARGLMNLARRQRLMRTTHSPTFNVNRKWL